MTWTALRLVALSLVTLCGCASTAPREVAAPMALTSTVLAQIGGAKLRAFDGIVAQGDAEAHLVRGEPVPTPVATPRPGYGFDRPLPGSSQSSPSDADVARLLDAKLPLYAPARLACVEAQSRREYVNAVFFGDPTVVSNDSAWTVRPSTPGSLKAIRRALDPTARGADGGDWPSIKEPRRHVFASITSIPSMFLPGRGDLGKVRYAAARVGCDAVLVYARATRVYTYRNGLANLYPTLIGLALPGNERIVVSRVEGAIVDVRTGHVFCVAQGEARVDESSSPLFGSSEDERQSVEEAETDAALNMTKDLARELAQLEASGRIKDRPQGASK